MRKVFVLCTAIASFTLVALTAAPLPKVRKKEEPKNPVIGSWWMVWAGQKCPTTFSPDGGYSCLYHDTMWWGTYTFKDNLLTVSEHVGLNSDGNPFVWSVKVDKDLKGSVNGDWSFKLTKCCPCGDKCLCGGCCPECCASSK